MTTIRTDEINGGENATGTIRSGTATAISSGYENSTVRVDNADISSGISANQTVRNISGTIKSGLQNITSFSNISDDEIELNNIKYQYVKIISKMSGESEVHLLQHENVNYIFKLYYPNFKPKEDILKQLKSLNHPDIINLIDYGYFNDRFYEVMDYAEGGTLDKYLPIRDLDEIMSIIDETINAFNYCHSRNIIHKDIKPENIYLKNADGTDILLGDFGISSLLDSGMTRQLTSQNLTVGYAAPEMYGLGGKVYVGKEVDYYALGVTIIHIWLGKSPFAGMGIHAIANLTTTGNIPSPGDMPSELKLLVKGLLTIDYAKRWGYEQVKDWLNGLDVPVEDLQEPTPTAVYKFAIAGRQNIAVKSLLELVSAMKMNPDYAKKNLFRGLIINWLNTFNPVMASKIREIVEDDYVDDQNAALQKAIYVINEEEPYLGAKGARCYSAKDISKELREHREYYTNRVFNNKIELLNHPIFLYIEARGTKEQADYLRSFATRLDESRAVAVVSYILDGASPEDVTEFITFTLSDKDRDISQFGASVVKEYNTSIAYFAECNQASTSLLENKYGFSYFKASCFIGQMEREGLIGQSENEGDDDEVRPVYQKKIQDRQRKGNKPLAKDKYSQFEKKETTRKLVSSESNTSKFVFVAIVIVVVLIILVSKQTKNSGSTSSAASDSLKTIKTSANLRSSPSKDASVVSTVNEGESVEIVTSIAGNGNWYKVKYNNVEGYIHKSLLK